MICKRCGQEIPDEARFCKHCGAKAENDLPYGQTRSKAPIYIMIGVFSFIFVLLLLGAGGTAYANMDLARKKNAVYKELSTCGFAEYEDRAKEAAEGWKELNILEIRKKSSVIKELRSIKNDLDHFVSEQISYYEDIDMSKAEDEDARTYKSEMETLADLTAEKHPDYASIKKSFEKMDDAVLMYVESENELDVQVQQVDTSDFPRIRLYVDVKKSGTDDVPDNLNKMMFYIKKEDADAKFVRQSITAANQLDKEESLKVDMVADVSRSMDGAPLVEAKTIMCNFIDSIQFDAGDMVELTSFSTGVKLEQEFCADASLLKQKVNSFTTDSQTSLYDALYTSVERAAGQTGARCVIAFTDGQDNYSTCSADDVISVAQRYHIPIFIIGIGTMDTSSGSYIASQTGGKYYSINDVYSMESIYQEIYRIEKGLYLIEFEDSTGASVNDSASIQVGYHSKEYGGECDYVYRPNVLLSAKSLDIYKTGPESVVEKYLKNFASAVTKNDFSYISDYLLPGSDIYNEQQKYVQRDIQEQLDTYEIANIEYTDNAHCIVSTRETYYVQVQGESLQLMTQECKYALEKSGDRWYMTAFVDLNVVSRIK